MELFCKFVYEIDVKNSVLAWRVKDKLELGEVVEIVKVIQKEVQGLPKGKIKLLVDNRFMVDKSGNPILFSTAVNDEWLKLQIWLLDYCSNVAVLCGSLIMKSQMSRLATTSGIDKVLKAFWNSNNTTLVNEAYTFLGISGNKLIES